VAIGDFLQIHRSPDMVLTLGGLSPGAGTNGNNQGVYSRGDHVHLELNP
jgi:hypothetical protein